jgi:hypothetical protein
MQIVAKSDKLWWAEKAAWFRNVPVTAVTPSPAQAEVRVKFGTLAREAKEKKATGTREKPAYSTRLGRYFVGAAAYIADNMAGYKAKAPSRLVPKKRLHTMEELKAWYGI